jgi:mono/diheme cytochrome c family protein
MIGVFFYLSLAINPASASPDWSENAVIPATGRPNPYELQDAELLESLRRGRTHGLSYPVDVTGLLVPIRPFQKLLNTKPGDPGFERLRLLLGMSGSFKGFNGMWEWLGLHEYPETLDPAIPVPPTAQPGDRMGFSRIHRMGAEGFTISCAACHSANLFGKPVLGMTNRFPRTNEFFKAGIQGTNLMAPAMVKLFFGANREEMDLYRELRSTLSAVGVKSPEVIGLDTSLAQVALSLSKRTQTPDADRSAALESRPRANPLDKFVADSKPAVWWNLKYKNRWLSDGSVVSGNPIFTNLLWNEIGRGADLVKLREWLLQNEKIIEEFTTAVFQTEAPRYLDFIPENRLDIAAAKRGKNLFDQTCLKCHGDYQKDWDRERTPGESLDHFIRTVEVKIPLPTKVVDVGTDPQRYQGMKVLAEGLNPLRISQEFGIVIKPQQGYVPPPLVGIWSRWPYFHNNSVPNLCLNSGRETTQRILDGRC